MSEKKSGGTLPPLPSSSVHAQPYVFPQWTAPNYHQNRQMQYWGASPMMAAPFMYAPPPAPPYTARPKRVINRKPTLATTLETEDLVVMGLVPKPLDIDAPAYPAHLPFIRCCYDSNEKKGCEKGSKCYHLHFDPAHRHPPEPPSIPGRNHEVYVDRPHFVAFDNCNVTDMSQLPCHYGIQCKDPKHREFAHNHKFGIDGMRDYETFLRNYRNYEFELIKYQLSVNKARRELTDDFVLEAYNKLEGNSSKLSADAIAQCEVAKLKLPGESTKESTKIDETKTKKEEPNIKKDEEYKPRPWLPTSGL